MIKISAAYLNNIKRYDHLN